MLWESAISAILRNFLSLHYFSEQQYEILIHISCISLITFIINETVRIMIVCASLDRICSLSMSYVVLERATALNQCIRSNKCVGWFVFSLLLHTVVYSSKEIRKIWKEKIKIKGMYCRKVIKCGCEQICVGESMANFSMEK